MDGILLQFPKAADNGNGGGTVLSFSGMAVSKLSSTQTSGAPWGQEGTEIYRYNILIATKSSILKEKNLKR